MCIYINSIYKYTLFIKVYVKFIDIGKKIMDTIFYPEQVLNERDWCG